MMKEMNPYSLYDKKIQKVNIIGLLGVIGSGKSYTAKRLCNKENYIELVIADEVKKLAHSFINIDIPNKFLLSFKDKGKIKVIHKTVLNTVDMRQYYINVGQNLKKTFNNENIWISKTIETIKQKVNQGNHNIVISDIRFKNELTELLKISIPEYDISIKIIFCNYKSSRYKIIDSESEKLAQSYLNKGFEHGQEIIL